jgi:lactoylglutathione lyase
MDIDHIVLAASDLAASLRHYEALFPVLGFAKRRDRVWANSQGIFIEIRAARNPSAAYARAAPGLNHLGVRARSRAHVDEIVAALRAAGLAVAEPQAIDAAYVVFVPDPDGLRVEVGYDPG